jgi:hypothetical protein
MYPAERASFWPLRPAIDVSGRKAIVLLPSSAIDYQGPFMSPTQFRLPLAACLLLAVSLQPSPVVAQQMSKEDQAIYDQMVKRAGLDPATMAKAQTNVDNSRRWSEGRGGLVQYHIVGVFKGSPNVIGGSGWIGYADVTDRVEIDLAWKLDESKLVGTPRFRNSKSVVRNVRNGEPKCLPPVLNGDYEHFDLLGIRQGLGGALEMQVQTTYPAAKVTQFCTGAGKVVPARVSKQPEELVVLSPVLFGMVHNGKDAVRVSADKKSLIINKGGWTWTYTPSVVK